MSHPSPCGPLWLLTCFLRVSSSSPQGGCAACALRSNSFWPDFQAVVGGSSLPGSSGSSWPAPFQVFLFLLTTLDCPCSGGTARELWFPPPPVSHSCFSRRRSKSLILADLCFVLGWFPALSDCTALTHSLTLMEGRASLRMREGAEDGLRGHTLGGGQINPLLAWSFGFLIWERVRKSPCVSVFHTVLDTVLPGTAGSINCNRSEVFSEAWIIVIITFSSGGNFFPYQTDKN